MLTEVKASRRNTFSQAVDSQLVFSMDKSSDYIVTDISGLGPVDNEISRSNNAIDRGSSKRAVRAGERNIVIQLGFKPGIQVDFARTDLYNVLMPGNDVELEFNTTDQGVLRISGTVEKNEPVMWAKEPTTSISIICPDPYFQGDLANFVSYTPPLDAYPQFSVPFNGTVPVGFIFEYTLTKATTTTSLFKLPYPGEGRLTLTMDLQANDVVRFNTIKGERSAQIIRYKEVVGVLGYFSGSLVKVKLEPGLNWFRFPDYGIAKDMKFTYEQLIGGI